MHSKNEADKLADTFEQLKDEISKQEAAQEKPYTARTSLVHKGKFCEPGTMYLIVETRRKNTKYTNALRVFTAGLTEEMKEAIFVHLWQPLQQKFNL